jgi:choline dehydrogenase-like flavoprotein
MRKFDPAHTLPSRMTETADTVVIGSGISGLLVAKELIEAGNEVTVVERGPMRLDADRLPRSLREEKIASTVHNTDPGARRAGHPWQYGYVFGGSSLLWSGVVPRLLPSDFEMRSRFGLWRDWPISYDDLLPFYRDAERMLEIAGGEHELFPGSDAYPVPPPEPSSADRLLGPLLEPFGPLAIARPKGQYPPPLEGEGENLEASFTMLGIARELAVSPGLSVRDSTVAGRLRTEADRVTAVECIDADGTLSEIRANRVVAATHGIENAALLLRSGLSEPAVGRWLGDHPHVVVNLELDRPVEKWQASTRDSGISYAWADGPWRSERASAVVIPFNPGLLLRDGIVDALAGGRHGPELRRRLSEKFKRTLVVYVSVEDAPREDRFVELSSTRDSLGLPRSRVSYPPDSAYAGRGLQQVLDGLEERLRPLGARIAGHRPGGRGGHMLGTCFMGPEGVVDENLRHHRFDNLYIAGGSAFPTHSALHPTATIAALAVRLGRHLATALA